MSKGARPGMSAALLRPCPDGQRCATDWEKKRATRRRIASTDDGETTNEEERHRWCNRPACAEGCGVTNFTSARRPWRVCRAQELGCMPAAPPRGDRPSGSVPCLLTVLACTRDASWRPTTSGSKQTSHRHSQPDDASGQHKHTHQCPTPTPSQRPQSRVKIVTLQPCAQACLRFCFRPGAAPRNKPREGQPMVRAPPRPSSVSTRPVAPRRLCPM